MMTKNLSPIAVHTTRTMRDLYPSARRSFWSEYSDMLLLAGGFVALYLFVMYFCVPAATSHQYSRVAAELQYYWGNTLEMKQYQLRTEVYPYIESALAYLASFL